MELRNLLKQQLQHPRLKELKEILDREKQVSVVLRGLHGSSKAWIIASSFLFKRGAYVMIANDYEEAGYFYCDLTKLLPNDSVYFFPSAFKRAIKYGQFDPSSQILRTEVLAMLESGINDFIIVTYPEALAELVVGKKTLSEHSLEIKSGQEIESGRIGDFLDNLGFIRVDYVYEPGQYAVRGSILDVFSFSCEFPYRIDFFGSEVESIRLFDIETQLSQERISKARIVSALNTGGMKNTLFFNVLPKDTMLFVEDIEWTEEAVRSTIKEPPIVDAEGFHSRDEMSKLLVEPDAFVKKMRDFSLFHFVLRSGKAEHSIHFKTRPQPLYHKNFELVGSSFLSLMEEGYTIYILSDILKQHDRIRAIFNDRGDNVEFVGITSTLHSGFIDDNSRCCFFTDHQLFDRFHKYNLKSDRSRSGKLMLTIKELNQFTVGDYLVHIDHGIGMFGGLIRTELNGTTQEVVKMIFQNNDILFVSIHALHKLSKYRGKDSGEAPALSKLGGGAWEKMKERTKSKVKDIARDLILLYSKRREERGFAFSADSFMQQELEASFIYEDTPDQEKATLEVKKDMEKDYPMDRLICGDVGFGKTEVAIRAAFKAVSDNKQVAVLVPTTVLAFQHYQTFSERLKNFPCTIDYLSRARTSKKSKEIVQNLKEGKIDIIIGTHRLVGKDVGFKDLGLLIIDEEQKFGVAVKEKLRKLKVNVDTLTMSATPIPRTLQFSLMGARDLSNITTPPPNRYPIQTELVRFSNDLLREAVTYEMERNGQVYIVNNRIRNIYELANLIRKLVPEARVGVGHGQMNPDELEKVILGFVEYDYDVLVATTIIENGIDVPNANTIIINEAHNFGLSELHQLRGRVGRSNRKAFCYLLSPPLADLTVEARRRLQAIESFSELGSGVHIAMQDLDIRGAGNMLGAEQSGFIANLGYETYQKVLDEAIKELKKEEFQELITDETKASDSDYVRETYIESDLELLFPAEYIPTDTERIELYRALGKIEKEREIKDFMEMLKDRFGPIPEQSLELIELVRLRTNAKKLGIEKLMLKSNIMYLYTVQDKNSPYYQSRSFGAILRFVQNHPKQCNVREVNDKRSVRIKNVDSVRIANKYILEMLTMPLN